MNKDLTGEELEHLLFSEKIEKQELALEMGVKPSAISNWIKRGIPRNKTRAILSCFERRKNLDSCSSTEETDSKSTVKIPKLANIVASAGVGTNVDNIDEESLDGFIEVSSFTHFFSKVKNKNSLVAITVEGSSMSPTFNQGDIAIVDKNQQNYIGDNLYVVNYAGNLLIKRLQYDPSLNVIEVISDNPDFKNYSIGLNEDQQYFNIIGIVISVMSNL